MQRRAMTRIMVLAWRREAWCLAASGHEGKNGQKSWAFHSGRSRNFPRTYNNHAYVLYPLARSAVEVVHNHREVIHREAWARYLVPLGARLAITDWALAFAP
jgi:hypothetical protein